jgi:hypothetical protein
VTLITWVTYVVVVLVLYLRPVARPVAPLAAGPRPAEPRPEPTGAAPAAGD